MVRRLFILLLVLGLAVAAYAGWWLFTTEPDREPPSRCTPVVVGAADDGWQQVVLPRSSASRCRRTGVRLETSELRRTSPSTGGPPTSGRAPGPSGCRFYGSDTFDPAGRSGGAPGASRRDGLPDGGWGGYVTPR